MKNFKDIVKFLDNGDITVYGKKVNTFDKCVNDVVNITFKENKYIIYVFNVNFIFYVKIVDKKTFVSNPHAFMYEETNGGCTKYGFSFRITSPYIPFLLSLPDLVPPISQIDISSILKEYVELYHYKNLGGVAEFLVSGNIEDLVNPCRRKKYDAWIILDGKRYKVPVEIKSSIQGIKPENVDKYKDYLLPYWSNKEGVKYVRESYSKSNEYIHYDI